MKRSTVIVNSEGRLVRNGESKVMRSLAAPAASSKIVRAVGHMNFRARDSQRKISSPTGDVRPKDQPASHEHQLTTELPTIAQIEAALRDES